MLIQKSEELEGGEGTLLERSAVWRLFAGTSATTRVCWHARCHLSTKLIFPGLCVCVWCDVPCAAQHTAAAKADPIPKSLSAGGESKGGSVSWEWLLGRPRESLSSEDRFVATVLSGLWGRCSRVARRMTQGCADSFRPVSHPASAREATCWLLSFTLLGLLCQPGLNSNRENFSAVNPGLTIAHRLLECYLWHHASLRGQLVEVFWICQRWPRLRGVPGEVAGPCACIQLLGRVLTVRVAVSGYEEERICGRWHWIRNRLTNNKSGQNSNPALQYCAPASAKASEMIVEPREWWTAVASAAMTLRKATGMGMKHVGFNG